MHPEMEEFIDHVVADGKITEKERQVLYRKAKELGEDTAELEIVLDAKLYEKTKSRAEHVQPENDAETEDEEIEEENRQLLEEIGNSPDTEKVGLINSLRIPNTRENFFPFLAYVLRNSKSMSIQERNSYIESQWTGKLSREYYEKEEVIKAWQSKASETIEKGKYLFSDGQKEILQLQEYEKKLEEISTDSLTAAQKKAGKVLVKIFIGMGVFAIVILALVGITEGFDGSGGSGGSKTAETTGENTNDEFFSDLLESGKYDTAYAFVESIEDSAKRSEYKKELNELLEERGLEIKEISKEQGYEPETIELNNRVESEQITEEIPDIIDQDYRALIIGIDSYSGDWNPLNNAVHDATEVAEVLESDYGFSTTLLLNEEATRRNILSHLERMTESLDKDENLLIYYSGHGFIKERLDEGFWVPADAETTSTADMISNETVKTFIRSLPSQHVLLIADSCFSGKLFRSNAVMVKRQNSVRYYEEVNKRASRQAFTSGGVEPVMDGGRDGHSVFSYYLLKALKNRDEKIFDAGELFQNVKLPVANNSKQTPILAPVMETGDEGGQFIFVKE